MLCERKIKARLQNSLSRTLQTGSKYLVALVKLLIFSRRKQELMLPSAAFRGIAQPGRALRSGRRGLEFESPYPDHKIQHKPYRVILLRP